MTRWDQPMTFAPFPEEPPEGWPTSYVALDDYHLCRSSLTAERDRLKEALEIMADPENWLGDPRDVTATIHGHFTPYELALSALFGSNNDE